VTNIYFYNLELFEISVVDPDRVQNKHSIFWTF